MYSWALWSIIGICCEFFSGNCLIEQVYAKAYSYTFNIILYIPSKIFLWCLCVFNAVTELCLWWCHALMDVCVQMMSLRVGVWYNAWICLQAHIMNNTCPTSAKWVLTFNVLLHLIRHDGLQLAASLVVVYINYIVCIHVVKTLLLNALWLGKLPYTLASVWDELWGSTSICSHYSLCRK